MLRTESHLTAGGIFGKISGKSPGKFPDILEISGNFFLSGGGPVPEIAPRDVTPFFSKFTLNHLDFWPFFKIRLNAHFFDKFTLNAEGAPEGHFGGFSGGGPPHFPGPPHFGHFPCVSFDFQKIKKKKLTNSSISLYGPPGGGGGA